MIATVSFDPDGALQVHEGSFRTLDEVPGSGALAVVPVGAFRVLDLFNEGRPGFDWDTDSGRCTELLIWALEDVRLEPVSFDELDRKVSELCEPGGQKPGTFQIELRAWGAR